MLNDLQNSLADFQPTPLSDHRFDVSHEWFEGQSNQQAQILDWLQRFGKRQIERRAEKAISEADAFRVLSVGCGSGILDLPLIKALDDQVKTLAKHATGSSTPSGQGASEQGASEQGASEQGVSAQGTSDQARGIIDYRGIDPNPVACQRFRDEFLRLDTVSTQLAVLEETVESYAHDRTVDLTHVVHSMYYFDDPAVSLQTLIENVADDGELVVFQAPKGELNRLADCFWQGHFQDAIWFSAELDEHLQQLGISFTRSRLDAEVDVTDCFDPNHSQGRLTFDFIVQSDCENLPLPVRSSVLEYLRSISRLNGGQLLAPHPVDVFVIHQSETSAIQSDADAACSP